MEMLAKEIYFSRGGQLVSIIYKRESAKVLHIHMRTQYFLEQRKKMTPPLPAALSVSLANICYDLLCYAHLHQAPCKKHASTYYNSTLMVRGAQDTKVAYYSKHMARSTRLGPQA